MAAPRCAVCGRFFTPDVRSRGHQRYCGHACARLARRERNREYKRQERRTPEGREDKRNENRTTRERLGWAGYMRFRRKADPEHVSRLNRAKCRRYYQRHREEILQRRREQRAGRKRSRQARSP